MIFSLLFVIFSLLFHAFSLLFSLLFFYATRNPQLSVEISLKNLSPFCLAYIGRILLTLHEKKKTTPEKEWVYPELGFMS